MNFEINNLTRTKIDKTLLKKVGNKTLKFVKVKIPEISVVIVGEAKIKELNRKYRKINKATDILTFDYGEIFICPSKSKEKNLAKLLIHGILHLAGQSHKTEEIWGKII